jgi:putative nucleotidyltransferase with HDIG domain
VPGTSPTRIGRAYLWAVPAAGLLTLTWAIWDVIEYPPSNYWLALAILTAFTGSFTVKVPGMVARLSVSEPFVFAATMLFGPAAGAITVAIDACVMSLRLMPSLRTAHRVLFNVGTLVVSVAASSGVFFSLSGVDRRAPQYPSLNEFIWPLYVFATCCFFINSGLVALALSVERGTSAFGIWRQQFMWLSVNYFAGASAAALLVVYARTVDLAILGVVIPLIAVSYLTFRTTLGRLDDANRHLSEVNTLYLSTIETLAMAIDAKDQVTHGHIRRVQRYAVGLARALGIRDDRQLRAIEAAALLHDMGKLAIPEFILNKPGALTASEFSVMKTHAAVGADMLSSIHFPYPVVPIVRHHHENWDGSGYPGGIRAADIPIGARILSVVDCYDALTSDRPYRPAMSAEQAIDILTQRRGKMYDPLVVDAFVGAHSNLRAEAEADRVPAILRAVQQDSVVQDAIPAAPSTPQAAPIESLRMLACLAPFPAAPPLRSVCLQLVDSLRTIATFDTAALFVVSDRSSEAEAIFAQGTAAAAVATARIPIGEQLTGWVAAHRTSVWNSDAALDLATTASRAALTLASGMPLCQGEAVVGVLTLYGQAGQEITVEQRRALESLLPSIATSLNDALQRPSISIDCRPQHVRDAALSAMDSLLSHNRLSSAKSFGCALAISFDGDTEETKRAQLSLESAVRLAAQRLSPRHPDTRCVLRLGQGDLLVCALDGAATELMIAEAEAIKQIRSLQAFPFSIAPISTSIELQNRVRQMTDSSPAVRAVTGVRNRGH